MLGVRFEALLGHPDVSSLFYYNILEKVSYTRIGCQKKFGRLFCVDSVIINLNTYIKITFRREPSLYNQFLSFPSSCSNFLIYIKELIRFCIQIE